MLTLKAAIEEAQASIDRVDAQVLVAHMLGVNRAYLAAHPMRILTESEDARFDTMVAMRAMGHPVAYIVGHREFYSRDFAVGPAVLIPRPETEVLVEAVLDCIDRHRVEGGCLDLGTGSGAIAVTLACERPSLQVTAVDASREALDTAQANAARHGARVELLQGPWYGPVAGRRFQLIVANPPYVAASDPHLQEGDLRFEPRLALTDGSDDGLDSLRAIVSGAREHLWPGGWLWLEHGHDQAAAVMALLAHAGFGELASIKDLAGIRRVAGGKIR